MHCYAPMKQFVVLCDLGFVDKAAVSQSDHSNVFHASNPELWHINLVVLRVRERGREKFLVILDSFSDDPELLLGIQVGKLAAATEDAHRHDRFLVPLTADVLNAVVFAGTEAVDVRTNLW